jgi:hypothetical protein
MLINKNVVSYLYMSETYTPPTQSRDNEEADDNFAQIQQWQSDDAARRAQGLIGDLTDHAPLEQSDKKTWTGGQKLAAGVVTAAALVGGALALAESQIGPEFSETTTEYTVQPGDGIYDAAENIQGIGDVDIRDAVQRIRLDPANTDVLKGGLQPGETLVIPERVQD